MIETERDPTTAEESAAPEWAIEIEHLTKSYGRTRAVRDLTMHVPPGSIYGFVGPNGAGKTTTIRTLATLQKPDAGSVRLAGVDVLKHPAEARDRLGYMPDFFGVYDRLTVGEYLDFYGMSHQIPAARRKVLSDELLELVDLTDKRNDSVEWLSRGMKQRLGLARCLMHDPQVLLLDEPASGMDPRARIELREILRELSKLDKTILISSHILPELAEMCTHIGIIRSGEMLAEGPVDSVIATLAARSTLRITVRTPQDLERVLGLLASEAHCEAPEPRGERSAVTEFSGDEDDLAELLRQLVGAGVAVTSFSREGGTLEDIFLELTELGENA
jgi:ABC-2 type transport system ATP-binding protein